MAPKRSILENMPKWWLKFRKWKAPRVIAEPPFRPAVPNEGRRDQIDESVVWFAFGDAHGYHSYLPAINLQGSHCLLFESTLLSQHERRPNEGAVTTYALRFPGELGVVDLDLPRNAMVEKVFDIFGVKIRLTALSYNTNANHCPPIDFGEEVVMGQRVFLYDLRYARPSLVEGSVTCVGEDAFVFDAKWCSHFLYGALVFDQSNSLVGVVFHDAGSPIAVHIGRLREFLLTFFPGIENMVDFHQKLQQI